MAFVCTINSAWAQGAGFDWQGESTLVAGIGYDDEHPISYSLITSLSTCPGALEFVFYVVGDNELTSEVRQFWSGRDTDFILKSDRARILKAAMMAADLLLQHCRPDRFFMITHDTDLPPKALVKSEMFCKVFAAVGYRVSDTFTQHGKAWWDMERVADPDVSE
jgi:hypothetical protein